MATKYLVKLGALLAVAGFIYSFSGSAARAVVLPPVVCSGPAGAHNPHCLHGGSNGGGSGNSTGKVLGQIGVAMAICSVVSPMIQTAIKGKLTYKEGHGAVVGCWLPIIGPWLLNAHYDRLCQLSRTNPAYRDSSIYCDPAGVSGGTDRVAAKRNANMFAALPGKVFAHDTKQKKPQTHSNARRRVQFASNFQTSFRF